MCSVLSPAWAAASEIAIERPGLGEYVRDIADMLDSKSKAHVRWVCGEVLKEKATPIIVVTIDSMAKYGGA